MLQSGTPSPSRYSALLGQEFDLLIIGGGILGCGIARDAALRGLKVALFEKEDFGCGTSSRSTRLIHGGLRYLEIGDFGLVRQDLREREVLLKIAPHRVKPLSFLVPLYRRSLWYRAKLRAGMILYDLLSHDKSLPKHRFLNREQTLEAESGLASDGLQGAALYYDAQCSLVERLCVDNIVDAAENGALVFNHTEVTGLLRGEAGRVVGVTVRDTLTGEEAEVGGYREKAIFGDGAPRQSPTIINAAGPWLDALTGRLTGEPSRKLRLTKGIHFAAPPAARHALVLLAEADARVFFVVPWLHSAWIGTTDTDFEGDPQAACATGDEVRYLIETVERVLPEADWKTVYYTSAGVRALVRDARPNARESDVSRRHRIIAHTAEEGLEGFVSVLGGKITAYRDIAAQAVGYTGHAALWAWARANDLRLRLTFPPCVTATRPLPGGDFTDAAQLITEAARRAAALHLDAEQAANLVLLYGTRYTQPLALVEAQPELGARLTPAYPDIRAQVHHAVQQEFVRTASDFLMRRSTLYFTPDQGQEALLPVVDEMAALLDWDEARCLREIVAYREQIARTQHFRSPV